MAIDTSLPVWRFEPDWSNDVTETLEWLTDVLTSPIGAEQRRALRFFPRQYLEFDVVAAGRERTLLDNLLNTYGGGTWYLPLWFDPHALTAFVLAAGSTVVPLANVADSELEVGKAAFIYSGDVFDFELVEIAAIGANSVTLTAPTTKVWRIGAILYPARKARAVEQPSLPRRSDTVVSFSIKFRVDESPDDDDSYTTSLELPWLTDTYLQHSILDLPPNEVETLDTSLVRLLEELDNRTSRPVVVDTAGREFEAQQYRWLLQGRAQHRGFKALLKALRGRAMPLWVPTFFTDFELAEAVVSGDSVLTVSLAGFTEAGSARPGRRHIMIRLADGTNFYREIVNSAAGSTTEVLALDQPLLRDIQPFEVQQISFISFVRLNQDAIEIAHRTDIEGVSDISMVFRSLIEPAFGDIPFGYFALTSKTGSITLTNKTGTKILLGKMPS